MGAGLAQIHHEAGVLFRDLGVAHPVTFETGPVDEGGGVVPLRALEGAAGGGQVQGLFVPALLIELPHFCGYLLPLPLFQTEHGGEQHAAPHFLEQAAAVTEAALLLCQLIEPLLRQVVEHHALHGVLQLPAVGSGVHDEAAPHAAGDAGGKFQTGELMLLGKTGQLCQGDPGLGIYGPVRQQEQFGQLGGADYEQVFQPLVGKEYVGAVAQNIGGQLVFFKEVAYLGETAHIRGHCQGPHRTAYLKRAVGGHVLVFQKLQAGHGLFYPGNGFFQVFHGILQSKIKVVLRQWRSHGLPPEPRRR